MGRCATYHANPTATRTMAIFHQRDNTLKLYRTFCFTSRRRFATVRSATMFSRKKNLSNPEHLVMDVLCKKGSATAEEVRASLAKRHFMKESTARTILSRLEEKGYVRHRVEGRTNIYSGIE